MIELDNNDLIILDKLNENGRATYSEIANELHLTVPTVKSRIDKLLKIGVIHHIGIYLNPHSLTNDSTALIATQINKKDKKEIFDYLRSIEEIKEIYEVLDEFNILIITQIQPLNMHKLVFEEIKSHPLVIRAKLSILTKEILSRPHRIPKHNTLLNIQCEYCGKQITSSYETEKYDEVRHYFCCKSCLNNYRKWHKKQVLKV
ncbi:MAG: winged helix-turn-helix transcriptional regulator [Candidatus Thorarchaeota archaeon]